tara:strand:- start:723 stop:959 length:237 start_codon:yes stop_codon:yes gene_type:complete
MKHRGLPKKEINKDNYHEDQNFCKDCNQPINQRSIKDILEGKCNRCYQTSNKENIKRKKSKKRTKERKHQRKDKYQLN